MQNSHEKQQGSSEFLPMAKYIKFAWTATGHCYSPFLRDSALMKLFCFANAFT